MEEGGLLLVLLFSGKKIHVRRRTLSVLSWELTSLSIENVTYEGVAHVHPNRNSLREWRLISLPIAASIHPLIYYPPSTDLVFHVSSIKCRVAAGLLRACRVCAEGEEGKRGKGQIDWLFSHAQGEGERTTKAE